MSGRYYKHPKVTATRRAICAAQADHRDDPTVPTIVMDDEIVREGAWADVPRAKTSTKRTKPRNKAPHKR